MKTSKAERIVRDFTSFDTEAKNLLQLISQLHTSRVSGFGFTAEADVLGVDRYAINEQLDVRTCPVCAMMHGRTFEVKTARNLYDQILFEDNPEVIKALQPWPSQKASNVRMMQLMSQDELVAKGWHVPPFHPWCRGLLVHVDSLPEVITDPAGTSALQKVLSTPVHANRAIVLEDFDALKKIPKVNVILPADSTLLLQGWDESMGDVTPSALFNMINKGFRGSLAANGGELSLWPNRYGDSMTLKARVDSSIRVPAPGGGSRATALAYFERTFERLRSGRLHVSHDYFKVYQQFQAQGWGKTFMSESMRLYEEMGVEFVRVDANIEVGAYAWAKYGFSPYTLEESIGLAKQVSARLAKLVGLPDNVFDAVKTVIQKMNEDPKAVWVLADIGILFEDELLAKNLLWRRSWTGNILLSDKAAMDRFWNYVGRPESV